MATSMNLRRVLQLFGRKRGHFRHKLPVSALGSCNLKLLSTSPEVEVEYPPVKPKWPPGMGNWNGRMEPSQAWNLHTRREELLAIPVIKERLEKMAEKSNYLWRVTPWELSTSSLPYMQYITKTHVVNGLPSLWQDVDDDVDAVYEQVKSTVIDALVLEHEQHRVYEKRGLKISKRERIRRYGVHSAIGHIVRSILACTSADNQHLLRAQVDEDVDVKTFWRRHGFEAEETETDHDPEKPLRLRGRWRGLLTMQYMHNADFQVRTELPLPQFVSVNDAVCQKGDYPLTHYQPKAVGQAGLKGRPTTVSGHWVGDPCEFGQVSFHVAPGYLNPMLAEWNQRIQTDVLTKCGLVTSFGWCSAQAHNQGFSWLCDLTYPFTTQTVVTTDGRSVHLFAYQLNTLLLWQDDVANPLRNVLWSSGELPLYDVIESGQVKGLNDDTLKQILKFFLLEPVHPGVDLRPYLPDEPAPVGKNLYINHKGDEPLPHPKIERWQLPRNAVYF